MQCSAVLVLVVVLNPKTLVPHEAEPMRLKPRDLDHDVILQSRLFMVVGIRSIPLRQPLTAMQQRGTEPLHVEAGKKKLKKIEGMCRTPAAISKHIRLAGSQQRGTR